MNDEKLLDGSRQRSIASAGAKIGSPQQQRAKLHKNARHAIKNLQLTANASRLKLHDTNMGMTGSAYTIDLVAGTGATDADPSASTGDPNYAAIVAELSTLKSRITTDANAIKSRMDNFNSFMRKGQPAQQGLQFTSRCGVNASPQDLKDELQLKADRINKECEDIYFAQRELEILREEKKQWTAQKADWENEKTRLEGEVVRLKSEASNTGGASNFNSDSDFIQRCIDAHEAEKKQSDKIIMAFRSLLQSKADGGVQIEDLKVQRMFMSLAYKIEDLVMDYYANPPSTPHLHNLEAGFQRELFGTLQLEKELTPKQRMHRIRTVLFRLVDKYILSRRSFGLDDLHSEIETGLDLFEYQLVNLGRARLPEVIDWRAQTVKFASCIHTPSQEWIEKAAQSFNNAMSPLLSLRPEDKDFDETNKRILGDWIRLCKSAFDLTLYVRHSRDAIYSCKYPEEGSQLDTAITIPGGREPCPAGARQNDISAVLAPAWIKYLPLEDLTLVLNKGKAVIYEHSQ